MLCRKNPIKVEKDDTAQLQCGVDSKPTVNTVKWLRNGRFIDTHFKHTIPRVTLQDAGSYVCSADNGLGQVGKAELQLDVLHAPIVSLPESREVKEGTDTTVECDIVANPRPATIQWTKEGDEKFHQNGPTLRLNNVNARHNGKYTCSATNQLQPTGKAKTLREGKDITIVTTAADDEGGYALLDAFGFPFKKGADAENAPRKKRRKRPQYGKKSK